MNVTKHVALSLHTAAALTACTDDSHVTAPPAEPAPALASTTPLRFSALDASGFHISAIAAGRSCC